MRTRTTRSFVMELRGLVIVSRERQCVSSPWLNIDTIPWASLIGSVARDAYSYDPKTRISCGNHRPLTITWLHARAPLLQELKHTENKIDYRAAGDIRYY